MYKNFKGLKRRKATGLNGMFMCVGNTMVVVLFIVMDYKCWLEDWTQSYIVPFFEAGDDELAEN